MNKFSAYLLTAALAGAAATASADVVAMQNALDHWDGLMQEYQAALQLAKTPDQLKAIEQPNGEEVALLLWHSVNKKTGKRKKLVQPTDAERLRGASDKYKEVATYEFEEHWAAPAVVWFLNHPQEFARVFGNKNRQISYFANAMLESVEQIHYASPHIADACAKLAESPSIRVYELLQKIYTRNQSPAAQAAAAMAMCIQLSNPTIASAEKSPEHARNKQLYFLRQAIILAPDNAMFGNVSLNDMAMEMSYAINNLSLDSIPPQMTLIDMNGNSVVFPKPGKPTLIFFWAPEESIGLDIVQRQELLAKQFPDLVFCPITTHQKQENWRAMLQQYNIPHCYMDNKENSSGLAYRVSQLPMAVLVDARCRILFIGFPNQQLQAALNNCFAPANTTQQTGADNAPMLQPHSQPKPAESTPEHDNTPPPLRDMPEF